MLCVKIDHGQDQVGSVSQTLNPFIIQGYFADDVMGHVRGTPVFWNVAVGSGEFVAAETALDRDGFAAAEFRPSKEGRYRVECRVGDNLVSFIGVVAAEEDEGARPDEEPVRLEDLESSGTTPGTSAAESNAAPAANPGDDFEIIEEAPTPPQTRRVHRWRRNAPLRFTALAAIMLLLGATAYVRFAEPTEPEAMPAAAGTAPTDSVKSVPQAPTAASAAAPVPAAESAPPPPVLKADCTRAEWRWNGGQWVADCPLIME